jgi:hypothetical protein
LVGGSIHYGQFENTEISIPADSSDWLLEMRKIIFQEGFWVNLFWQKIF